MKVLHTKTLKSGKLHLLVEVSPKESLMSIKEDEHYQLGGQVEDIVKGHVKYSDIVSDGGLDPRNKFDAPSQENT